MRVRGRTLRGCDCDENSVARDLVPVAPLTLCAEAVPADARASRVAPNVIASVAVTILIPLRITRPPSLEIDTLADQGRIVNRPGFDRDAAGSLLPLLGGPFSLEYNNIMAEVPLSDPLAWRPVKAPSLEELEVLAIEAFRRLPENFRALCEDLVIRVDDFPTDEVLEQLQAQTEFDLLGLFQGVGLPFRSESAPVQMPNLIWLYRRPILDYWAEHDETLGAIVTHVLVHEIGHHFGLSDDDMMGLEKAADEEEERTTP